jgi:serine/threonine protein kinase
MKDYSGITIDRYRIMEKLGHGGMAVVYKAFDTRLEREAAIKLIRTDEIPPSQLDRLLKRFEREAKSQARFSHPNIVPVFDYGEYEGVPYLVLEYLSGGTLKDRLKGVMDIETAINIIAPIADGLAYAHDLGVIHRDVKPSNILFNHFGRPLLTDFGIAKLLESDQMTLTGTGLGVGTPEYMAPEQWKGISVPQTDMYALGVVLYEMVTGQKPYTADTPIAIALMQMSEPLRLPSELIAGISENAEQLLLKALAKQPENRYKNMHDFYSALLELQNRQFSSIPRKPTISFTEELVISNKTFETQTGFDDQETIDEYNEQPIKIEKVEESLHEVFVSKSIFDENISFENKLEDQIANISEYIGKGLRRQEEVNDLTKPEHLSRKMTNGKRKNSPRLYGENLDKLESSEENENDMGNANLAILLVFIVLLFFVIFLIK